MPGKKKKNPVWGAVAGGCPFSFFLAGWLHRPPRGVWAAVPQYVAAIACVASAVSRCVSARSRYISPQYVAAIACVASSSREMPKSESLTNLGDMGEI